MDQSVSRRVTRADFLVLFPFFHSTSVRTDRLFEVCADVFVEQVSGFREGSILFAPYRSLSEKCTQERPVLISSLLRRRQDAGRKQNQKMAEQGMMNCWHMDGKPALVKNCGALREPSPFLQRFRSFATFAARFGGCSHLAAPDAAKFSSDAKAPLSVCSGPIPDAF